MKKLWQLFYTFAIVGVTTFGGGYAMLPALQREVVEKRGWATEEELMDWYAIGQCTPGVIAAFIQGFADIPAVQHAFAGIRACVCVLILNAVVKLWKKSVIDWKTGVVFAVVFLGSVFLHLSPVIYVIIAALAGILLKRLEVKA